MLPQVMKNTKQSELRQSMHTAQMDKINKTVQAERLKTLPASDGFHMPGEFEPHKGTIMIWPERPGSWAYGARDARKAFAQIAEAIAEGEDIFMLAGPSSIESAKAAFSGKSENIHILPIETDDAWARDVGPTFVKNARKEVRGINWRFNAWGGEVDGLYASWEKDDAAAEAVCDALGYPVYDAGDFVLEGGSIHSDGEGTLLVTEACLLSPGRNPRLTKEEIEKKLCEYLGAKKVIWLKNGIWQDETNEHVDNVCAFLKPGEVVLAWTDNEDDPQYVLSKACLDYLESECDAKGRKLVIHKLPIPDVPICVTKEELEGYCFEEGEDVREEGERLAASYVNFYFSNGAVVMPEFGGENKESDVRAQEIMKKLCPEREIIAVDARDILTGGGNIHCITQQIPEGRKRVEE